VDEVKSTIVSLEQLSQIEPIEAAGLALIR
jgi:hypothetical protein